MKQVRFVPIEDCQLQVREPQEGEQESRTVVGMPIVYGVRSVNLTPWSEDREVYEVLEAGFITPELLQRSDVILNLNHSTKVPDVLGRYRNSERDTLSLDLVPQGMKCRCTFPHTNNANDTLELMKRGDITGMSFAFTDDPHNRESVVLERTAEMSANGKEIWIRRVKRATGFYDVAIVTHPAYEQTMVGTREFGEAILREIDEQIKRECGDDDEAKRAEEEAKKKADEEAKAKEEQEARELAEREQKEREAVAVMRMRRNRLALQNRDIETFSY